MSGTDGEVGGVGEFADVLARGARVRGDRDAEFTAFMTAHAGDLRRTAWLLVGDLHRAEELTQEALARTYASWNRARVGEPLGYARRVLVNLRIGTWRRRRREVLTEPGRLPDTAARGPEDQSDDRDLLAHALGLLNPRQRRVVVLRHLVGLTEAQVAADLGVAVGTVRSSASRALAILRAALDPDGGSR